LAMTESESGLVPEVPERRFRGTATMDGYGVTHQSLIGKVVAGDDRASTRFWRIYSPLLDKCAMRYGIEGADLDEFRVDTMAEFFKGVGRFRYDPSMRFQTYFYTIVKNRAFRYLERRHRDESRLVRASGEEDADATDAVNVENIPGGADGVGRLEEEEWMKYMAAKARELMRQRVPPRTYQVFAFLEQGHDAAAICKALGVRKTVVYEHRTRALEAYRAILSELNDPVSLIGELMVAD